MASALFLDRDGVIVENRPRYVRSWADIHIFPQALAALVKASRSPHRIIIVTNQSAVNRGLIERATADQINGRLAETIRQAGGRVDAIQMCPHVPEDGCACRKPAPGLLLEAARQFSLDLSQSMLVGDALSDIQAGRRAGLAQAVLVRTGRGESQLRLPLARQLEPLPVFANLAAALDALL